MDQTTSDFGMKLERRLDSATNLESGQAPISESQHFDDIYRSLRVRNKIIRRLRINYRLLKNKYKKLKTKYINLKSE